MVTSHELSMTAWDELVIEAYRVAGIIPAGAHPVDSEIQLGKVLIHRKASAPETSGFSQERRRAVMLPCG